MTWTDPFVWQDGERRPLEALLVTRSEYRARGKRVVSTNGCFDLVHAGHVRFLGEARSLGDVLVVGLNSDASVRRLKGAGHPIVGEAERAATLAALRVVDHVVVFDDFLPNALLSLLKPDVHCKAGDYTLETLPEAQVVRKNGGEVRILPLAPGLSTSGLIQRVLTAAQDPDKREAPTQKDSHGQAQVIAEFLATANAVRQTGYHIAGQLLSGAQRIAECVSAGHRVLVCSSARGGPLAEPFVDAFRRRGLPAATAVVGDGGRITGCESVAANPATNVAGPGDVLVAVCTDGDGQALRPAIHQAKARGAGVVLIGAKEGGLDSSGADCYLSITAASAESVAICQWLAVSALAEAARRELEVLST